MAKYILALPDYAVTECAAVAQAWIDMGGSGAPPSRVYCDCCSFPGVTCATGYEPITSMQVLSKLKNRVWASKGLTGTISSIFAPSNFSNLQTLNLSSNALTGLFFVH